MPISDAALYQRAGAELPPWPWQSHNKSTLLYQISLYIRIPWDLMYQEPPHHQLSVEGNSFNGIGGGPHRDPQGEGNFSQQSCRTEAEPEVLQVPLLWPTPGSCWIAAPCRHAFALGRGHSGSGRTAKPPALAKRSLHTRRSGCRWCCNAEFRIDRSPTSGSSGNIAHTLGFGHLTLPPVMLTGDRVRDARITSDFNPKRWSHQP
jgi:hypothetical protein